MPDPWPAALAGWGWRLPMTVRGSVAGLSGAISGAIAIPGVPAGLKAVCQAAGQDFRAALPDGTLLYHGHEAWSATEPVTYVLLPTQPTGDQVVYLYGGNGLALDAQRKDLVSAGYAGYWPLGDAGPTTAYDWTANANDGTQSGGVTFGAAGKTGPACALDGTDDTLNCGSGASLAVADAVTVAAWINPSSTASLREIVVKSKGALTDAPYLLRLNAGGGIAFVIFSGTAYATAASAVGVSAGTWYHVAGRYNRTNAQVYINGAASGAPTAATFALPAGGDLIVGNYPGMSRNYPGSLDGLAISPAALSADQIKFAAKSYPGSTMFTFGALEAAPVSASVFFRRSWGGTRAGSRGVL